MIKIATWNVNSVRVRLNQLLTWIKKNDLDLVALQETKCEDEKFPAQAFLDLGYYLSYSGQKSYNGVAFISKQPLVTYSIQGYLADHPQKRVLVTEYKNYCVVNVYIPNGQAVGSEKYQFKLEWLQALHQLVVLLKKHYKKIILLGDFNIAPEEIDQPSAGFIKDDIMVSPAERQAFFALIDLGFHDSFRLFCKEPKEYTWWDYRTSRFAKNLGYRIDHILVSDAMIENCVSTEVDRSLRGLEQPSDHAPVILTVIDS